GQLEAKRAVYWPDLSLEELAAAREAPPALVSDAEEAEEAAGGAPELMAIARSTLRDLVGEEAYRRGGYTIRTTLDLPTQRAAREALRAGLEALDGRHGYRAPLEAPRRARPLPSVDRLRVGGSYEAEVTGVDAAGGRVLLSVGGPPAAVRLASAARYNPGALPA